MIIGGKYAGRLAAAGALILCAALQGAAAPRAALSGAAGEAGVSWASAKDAWASRGTGVFATENAGRTWHEIYSEPALSVLRLSTEAGVIELGTGPDPCMCTTRSLWTDDDGATWHPTDAIGENFIGAGHELYWWSGGALREIAPFPPAHPAAPLDAKLVTTVPDGTIVDGFPTPDGFAFLVSNRVAGQHWDTNPRVVLTGAAGIQVVQLPAAPTGEILANEIAADGPDLTVVATNYGVDPVATVTWSSTDDGQTWSLSA